MKPHSYFSFFVFPRKQSNNTNKKERVVVVKFTHLELSVKVRFFSNPPQNRKKRKGVGVRCSISFSHCIVIIEKRSFFKQCGNGVEFKKNYKMVMDLCS